MFSKRRRREIAARHFTSRCNEVHWLTNKVHWLTLRQLFFYVAYLVAIAYVDGAGNRVRGDYDDRRQPPEGGSK